MHCIASLVLTVVEVTADAAAADTAFPRKVRPINPPSFGRKRETFWRYGLIPTRPSLITSHSFFAIATRYKRYQSQTGFQEWNFCHPQTEISLKTSPKWEQLDQWDCLLWSAYEVWLIRLFVLLILWTFRVTQALFLHDSYLSIWLPPRTRGRWQF